MAIVDIFGGLKYNQAIVFALTVEMNGKSHLDYDPLIYLTL